MNPETLDVEFEEDTNWQLDSEYISTLSAAEGWGNESEEEKKLAREKMEREYGVEYSLDDDLPDPVD